MLKKQQCEEQVEEGYQQQWAELGMAGTHQQQPSAELLGEAHL
jgi:hypothetical protein